MKLFVTDAQILAMQATAAEAAWEDYRRTLGVMVSRHDAEMQRVRADRRDELERLADPQGPYLAHLSAEIVWLRMQLVHERQRAEISVDQRLSERGLGPVTLPPRPVAPEQVVDVMAELLKNTDFAAMGSAEGVAQ